MTIEILVMNLSLYMEEGKAFYFVILDLNGAHDGGGVLEICCK